MATHSGFGAFEDGREEWASYTERLEQYFTTNNKDCREEACYLAQRTRSGNLPSYPQSHDPVEADGSHF